jgi:catechol 2,3-dioxygenase-like lactoylglutathione lyase family enzyme
MPARHKKHWRVAPCFLVDDVVATAKFYRDKLGFHYDEFWGKPPRFCMVYRDGITIMLCQHAAGSRTNGSVDGPWDAYFWVADADALSATFKRKRVKFILHVGDREYGCRDFIVDDCNGYRLCFGHDI